VALFSVWLTRHALPGGGTCFLPDPLGMPFTGNLQYVLLLRSYSLSTLTVSGDCPVTPLSPLSVRFIEGLCSTFSCSAAILYQPSLSRVTCPVTPLSPLSVRFAEVSQYVFLLRSYSLPTLTVSDDLPAHFELGFFSGQRLAM
jgi:hypothetical protein